MAWHNHKSQCVIIIIFTCTIWHDYATLTGIIITADNTNTNPNPTKNPTDPNPSAVIIILCGTYNTTRCETAIMPILLSHSSQSRMLFTCFAPTVTTLYWQQQSTAKVFMSRQRKTTTAKQPLHARNTYVDHAFHCPVFARRQQWRVKTSARTAQTLYNTHNRKHHIGLHRTTAAKNRMVFPQQTAVE